MTLRAAGVVPPMVLNPAELASIRMPVPLPMARVPWLSVPIKLPWMRAAVASPPDSSMPAVPLPEMRLPAPAAVPPIVVLAEATRMPVPLGKGAVPCWLVPMKLPSIVTPALPPWAM